MIDRLYPRVHIWAQWNNSLTYGICMFTKRGSQGRHRNARQQEETSKRADSLERNRHHWSLLKLSDMCLPFSFFPRYSNCSMVGNSRSSPKHRGWICAFLFSITVSPDRHERTYFRGFFLEDMFHTGGHVKSCPPCCIWLAKCRCKIKEVEQWKVLLQHSQHLMFGSLFTEFKGKLLVTYLFPLKHISLL